MLDGEEVGNCVCPTGSVQLDLMDPTCTCIAGYWYNKKYKRAKDFCMLCDPTCKECDGKK